MGRANVYLPDELERRVKAAAIPISEVCQRALLAAVEAAEKAQKPFDAAVVAQFRRGCGAGSEWVATAGQSALLTLLRDQRFAELPAEALPADFYTLTQDEALGWEAGFTDGARSAIRLDAPAGEAAAAETSAAEHPEPADADEQPDQAGPASERTSGPTTAPTALGDDSGCQIGETLDGAAVCFDPHAALRAGKSPLFAVLGEADPRARLTFSLAQDAAARGTGVIVIDLSGELSSRATGLGRNVRLMRTDFAMPQFEDLAKGAIGLGGLWQAVSNLGGGSGLLNLMGQSGDKLLEPGYVTVLNLSGDAALPTALSAAQGLTGLLGRAAFPRLIQVDLPSGAAIPPMIAGRLGQIVRTAREQNIAVGLSAQSASGVTGVAGSGAPLSTIIALPTASPAEADRLRTLMGPDAPILLNAPGTVASPADETWAAMRDLQGRLGQVRIAAA